MKGRATISLVKYAELCGVFFSVCRAYMRTAAASVRLFKRFFNDRRRSLRFPAAPHAQAGVQKRATYEIFSVHNGRAPPHFYSLKLSRLPIRSIRFELAPQIPLPRMSRRCLSPPEVLTQTVDRFSARVENPQFPLFESFSGHKHTVRSIAAPAAYGAKTAV